MPLLLPLSPAVCLTTLDFARAQPPFCIDLRPVHRSSDYIGATGGHAAVALEAARRQGEATFEIRAEAPEAALSGLFEALSGRTSAPFTAVAGLTAGGVEVAFQKFTFSPVPGDGLFEISMDYVFVDPERRGHGYRDIVQTCLFGAALLTAIDCGLSVRLKFHQVKNPNNVARYEAGGYESVPEWVEEESDEPYACYRPSLAVALPSSYQRLFLTTELRRRLETVNP